MSAPPFVPGRPAPPPDERLVLAIATDAGLPAEGIYAFLAGACPLHGEARLAVLRSLWAPIEKHLTG